MIPTRRLTAPDGALLIVDVQEKLFAKIPDRHRLADNIARLARGASLLEIPAMATEQYPRGLGTTIASIADLLPDRPAKMTFHALGASGVLEMLRDKKVRHVTLAGIEAHICIAQTALELLDLGFVVQVAADAVASRHEFDWEFALRRLERAGVVIGTTESVLFEWVETAEHPGFKAISALVTGLARVDKMGFPVEAPRP